MGLGLSWGTRPNFLMEIGFGLVFCIGLAHEAFGLRFELQPRPNFVFSFGFGLGLVDWVFFMLDVGLGSRVWGL